jgi:hypothetical protein
MNNGLSALTLHFIKQSTDCTMWWQIIWILIRVICGHSSSSSFYLPIVLFSFLCYTVLMAIVKSVNIPANKRLHLELPPDAPSGRADMVLVLSDAEETPRVYRTESFSGVKTLRENTPDYAGMSEAFPSIEDLMVEAERKTAERFACPSGDSLQKYCGILKDIFPEDGLVYQRQMRDEWPD